MGPRADLNLKSLRAQVYDYLKGAITRGEIHSGEFLDLNRIGEDLGISRTPLRDALIQLETEGFVSTLPRRGVKVNALTLAEIRHLYEMIGALEGVVVMEVQARLGREQLRQMRSLNAGMRRAIRAGDFDTYYDLNLSFHNVFLDLSDNERLLRTVNIFKQRLYDFPRRESFVKEWEMASTGEHAEFLHRLEKEDIRGAADYMRDVHWSFSVQERYVRRYYFANRNRESG
jgi:DNA-binding GntR family transcriptional regulator